MRRWLFVPLLALSGCGVSSTWQALRENAAGVKLLQAQNPAGASERFITGLADAPFEPALHLNLGLALDQQKKSDDAIKSYIIAESLARTDQQRFLARFNLGEILGRAKKVDEALAWYQKALEIKPDSLETKVNIELLTNAQGQGQGGDDQQDQQGEGKGESKQDPKDQKDDQDKKDSEDKPKEYGQNQKYKPRPFKGELSESEVKKILGEIRQQEQKIRAEFNRKDVKERPRDKDW